MISDFPRTLTLLRKEKGISQKKAAAELGISQALLSHYEKGIRECGLEFLVKVSDFYGVSCDYLLGRSPEKTGSRLTVEDIPEADALGKENIVKGSILPTLNKKLIFNSLNILFEFLRKSNCKTLISEVSSHIMLSIYKMFRLIYFANRKNDPNFFTVHEVFADEKINIAINNCEANIKASLSKAKIEDIENVEDESCFEMSNDSLTKEFPLFSSSLLNLIQNSENKINNK
ncbi:MAG: helix-turn-helix transcriptional regulator [Oscillospiraceae bacterium]|nr:helix-turn-helix transcriptional regulator [Oscillospiraceae bacterium]